MSEMKRRELGDDYLALVRAFPLVPMKDEGHYEEALGVINRLAIREERLLSEGERDYLDALSTLTEAYAEGRYGRLVVDMSAGEALQCVMESSGTSMEELGQIVGEGTGVEELVRGERELTKEQVVALARHFHVDAGLFLGV
jgi:antitoxin component HigA of HigAB toxin-antitoxin module